MFNEVTLGLLQRSSEELSLKAGKFVKTLDIYDDVYFAAIFWT